MLNVRDFGAKGDGVVDDTAPLQHAIDSSKGVPIYIPAGVYRVTSTLNLNTSSTVTVYQNANKLFGDGKRVTILRNESGQPCIRHETTSEQKEKGVRMVGGYLRDFSIESNGFRGGGGIELFNYFSPTIERLFISGQSGDAIAMPKHPDYAGNPDHYSCGLTHIIQCEALSNGGIGINLTGFSNTHKLESNYIVKCRKGGIVATGAAHSILCNTIAGCGNPQEPETSGIHLVSSKGLTQHHVLVRGNEIDNNYNKQLRIEGYNNFVEQNRFVQSAADGAFKSTHSIYLAVARNNIVRNNHFRNDFPSQETTTNCYVDVDCRNNRFVQNVFTNRSSRVVNYDIDRGAGNIATDN